MTTLAKVLIVDDEQDIIELVSLFIKVAGYSPEIRSAHSADSALAIFNQDGGFDLVISDIRMPGGHDGLWLIETLRKSSPDLKIISMSGHSDYSELDIKNRGANYFLKKPFNPNDLKNVIENILNQ